MSTKGMHFAGSLASKAIEFCSFSDGRTLKEIAAHIERTPHVTHSLIAPSLKSGSLIRAGIHPWSRYFSNQEHANAFSLIAPDLVKEHKAQKKLEENERNREYWRLRTQRETAERRAIAASKPKPAKPKRQSTAMRPSGLTLSTRAQDQERKRDHKQATIIYPENYKYTKAPTPRDDRFTFTPPSKEWRGVISQDQQERWAA